MDNFLRYFYQDIGRVLRAFVDILSAIFNFLNYLLNFPMRMEIIRSYDEDFGTMDWVMLLLANLLLVALIVALVIGAVKLCRKVFRFRVSVKEYDEMAKQVRNLQRDLLRANYEKDKLLAMKVAELGGDREAAKALLREAGVDGEEAEGQEEAAQASTGDGNRNTLQSPCVDPSTSRFFRLTGVDNYYKTQSYL